MAEIKSAQSREARHRHDETLLRLMTEHETPIRRMCCIYLRDEHLAADAVQETFLRA